MRFPFVVCRRGVAVIKSCVSFASVGCIRDSSGIRGALNQNNVNVRLLEVGKQIQQAIILACYLEQYKLEGVHWTVF